ncbi:MAG: hypothetical protein ACE5I1_01830 [bacterium]
MRKQLFALAAVLLCGYANATAQGLAFPGGRGLTHLHTAWTLEKGSVALSAFTTSFYKPVLVNTLNQGQSSITYWDVQGVLGINYASGKHLEWNLTNILYQDTHRDTRGYNLPSDLSFSAKLGSFGGAQSHFRFGLLLEGKLPTAKHHNIFLEPYSAGKFEAGVTGLVSYSTDLLIPEAGFNAHLNLGFWHHNDTGEFLTNNANDNISVLNPSRQFIWGIGLVLPKQQVDFGLEMFGNMFIVRPPVTAYSREDYVYLTPSVTFRPSGSISLLAGVDVRVTKDYDRTRYTSDGTTLPRINVELPSYPGWRLRLGGKVHLNKPMPREIEKPLFTQDDLEQEPETQEVLASQVPLQEQLVKERRETELAEEELERIRSDRRKMEEMLARLRQILRYGKETKPSELTDKNKSEKEKTTTKKN